MCVLCGQMCDEIHWSERLLDPEAVSQGAGKSWRWKSRHTRTRLIGKVLAHLRAGRQGRLERYKLYYRQP
jgi:hypothetical protein